MDGSWEQLERDVQRTFAEQDVITPRELGVRLGMSESAAASLLAILALDGKVAIAAVARPASGRRSLPR